LINEGLRNEKELEETKEPTSEFPELPLLKLDSHPLILDYFSENI
jgi:hypothetical protein